MKSTFKNGPQRFADILNPYVSNVLNLRKPFFTILRTKGNFEIHSRNFPLKSRDRAMFASPFLLTLCKCLRTETSFLGIERNVVLFIVVWRMCLAHPNRPERSPKIYPKMLHPSSVKPVQQIVWLARAPQCVKLLCNVTV